MTTSLATFMRYIVIAIGLAMLAGCATFAGDPFDIYKGKVRFTNQAGGHRMVEGADPNTFQHIGGIYGKDAQRVYYAYSPVKGADPITIEFLFGSAARDANSIYVRGKRCADCDATTFRHIEKEWYADKNSVYHEDTRRADMDVATFKVLNEWYEKDKNQVYARGAPIRGADAASFKLASCGICAVCGEDKNRCYWYEHAVPCNCAPHSGGEFPFDPPSLPKGQAYITSGGYVGRYVFLDENRDRLPGVRGRSRVYRLIDPGRYQMPLVCKVGPKRGPMAINVEIKPARLYRITAKEGTWCDAEVQENALIVGRAVEPEIQVRLGKIDKVGDNYTTPGANPVLQVDRFFNNRQTYIEFRQGKNSFDVVCREVRREGILEKEVHFTEDLKPGRIYQVEATYQAPDYKCDARLVLQEN